MYIEKSFHQDISLKSRTSFKIGGSTKFYLLAETRSQLQDALGWCAAMDVPWFVLGGGNNVLIDDQGFEGLVLKLGGEFKEIRVDKGREFVYAGAGVGLSRFAMTLAKNGIAGYEFAGGIPGSLGGAIRMNAGTKDGEIQDGFQGADILIPGYGVKKMKRKDMDFSYRSSVLSINSGVVLGSRFAIKTGSDPNEVLKRIKTGIASRRKSQPGNRRNCGSIFKNTGLEKPAGWYIDQCDLKGRREGGAMIAKEHANWIVNVDMATSQDVKALIDICQEKVYKKFQISLEREVVFVPQDLK